MLFALAGLALLLALALLFCFFTVFYSPTRKPLGPEEYDLPVGADYEPYRQQMIDWMRMTRQTPCQHLSIQSFDGLTLRGRYYEFSPDAPVELLFHGYRGNAERDLSGGVARSFAMGHSALLIDQRASGFSDGHIITFGIREHRDCLDWTAFASKYFGKDRKLILTGISMGAATVMMAAQAQLPEQVIYILADCGYTSPREIICKVCRDVHFPIGLTYPLVRLAGRLLGGFDLEAFSPEESVAKSQKPIIFIHGEADNFVPCDMSRQLYERCAAPKKLLTVPQAGHGLAYPVDKDGYLQALREFKTECGC